ncbi:MAG: hypothetical protein EBU08_13695 [Micrococcales bacterium]|nr:hypothetical protein [Micrococcales bacterium]
MPKHVLKGINLGPGDHDETIVSLERTPEMLVQSTALSQQVICNIGCMCNKTPEYNRDQLQLFRKISREQQRCSWLKKNGTVRVLQLAALTRCPWSGSTYVMVRAEFKMPASCVTINQAAAFSLQGRDEIITQVIFQMELLQQILGLHCNQCCMGQHQCFTFVEMIMHNII